MKDLHRQRKGDKERKRGEIHSKGRNGHKQTQRDKQICRDRARNKVGKAVSEVDWEKQKKEMQINKEKAGRVSKRK